MVENTRQNKGSVWENVAGLVAGAGGLFAGTREQIDGLAGVLSRASGVALNEALEHLMRLGQRSRGGEAWDHLARHLDRLNDDQRAIVLHAGREHWGETCQRLGTSPDAKSRAAAARIAGLSDAPEVILELPALLNDVDPEVSRLAAGALSDQVRRMVRGVGVTTNTRSAIHSAVAEGVCGYERHRRREALSAAIEVLSTPASIRGSAPILQQWINTSEHPSHMSMRSVLKRGDDRMSCAAAWVWMQFPSFQSACAGLVVQGQGITDRADVLALGHLLANPRRRQALSLAVTRAKTAPGDGGPLAIDDQALESVLHAGARHAPRLLAVCPDPIERLTSLIADARPIVRYNVRRALAETAHALGQAQALSDLCFDPHERIAESAWLGLNSAGVRLALDRPTLDTLAQRLTRSPHTRVRSLAAMSGPALQPWASSEAASRLTARRMLRADPVGFADALRSRVGARFPVRVRLEAVRLADRLKVLPAIELELLTLVRASARPTLSGSSSSDGQDAAGAQRDEMRVAASAVVALARLDSGPAQDAVRRCLNHPDARVRANALDALARRDRCRPASGDVALSVPAILELKNDTHHRVRASAIRAEMLTSIRGVGSNNASEGLIDAVLPMLQDQRDMHRVAGLWLAERLISDAGHFSADAISGVLARMVSEDPSGEVRRRARLSAGRLLVRMRMGWEKASSAGLAITPG